jgi:hypothetical protein
MSEAALASQLSVSEMLHFCQNIKKTPVFTLWRCLFFWAFFMVKIRTRESKGAAGNSRARRKSSPSKPEQETNA